MCLGVFDRFARLKVFLLETGCGWIAHFLERLDAKHKFLGIIVGVTLMLLVGMIYVTGRCYPNLFLMAIRQFEVGHVSIPSVEAVGHSRIAEAVKIADGQNDLQHNVAVECCFDSLTCRSAPFPNLFDIWRQVFWHDAKLGMPIQLFSWPDKVPGLFVWLNPSTFCPWRWRGPGHNCRSEFLDTSSGNVTRVVDNVRDLELSTDYEIFKGYFLNIDRGAISNRQLLRRYFGALIGGFCRLNVSAHSKIEERQRYYFDAGEYGRKAYEMLLKRFFSSVMALFFGGFASILGSTTYACRSLWRRGGEGVGRGALVIWVCGVIGGWFLFGCSFSMALWGCPWSWLFGASAYAT
jgi:hypothetical protein